MDQKLGYSVRSRSNKDVAYIFDLLSDSFVVVKGHWQLGKLVSVFENESEFLSIAN